MSRNVSSAVAVTVSPVTTANANPCRSIRSHTEKITPSGMVMSREEIVAIVVAKSYRPCAPTSAQQDIPIFMVTLPNAIKGNRSVSMAWIVSSCVSHAGIKLLKLKKMTVTSNVIMLAMNIALYAASFAVCGRPFPS